MSASAIAADAAVSPIPPPILVDAALSAIFDTNSFHGTSTADRYSDQALQIFEECCILSCFFLSAAELVDCN